MDAERWQRAQEIFRVARLAKDQAAYLYGSCSDSELRRTVQELLEHDRKLSPDFLAPSEATTSATLYKYRRHRIQEHARKEEASGTGLCAIGLMLQFVVICLVIVSPDDVARVSCATKIIGPLSFILVWMGSSLWIRQFNVPLPAVCGFLLAVTIPITFGLGWSWAVSGM